MRTYPGLGIVAIDTFQEVSRDESGFQGRYSGGGVLWFVARPAMLAYCGWGKLEICGGRRTTARGLR